MTTNIYQARKQGNLIITMARRIFGEPQYAKSFTVLAISRIANAKGIDEAIKLEFHVPGNPKASDTKHISLIGYTVDTEARWPYMLHAEAKATAKKMRMVKSRARQVRSLDQVNGAI